MDRSYNSWINSLYMCVAMLTTVGFGDHTPTTSIGKLVWSPYVCIGCLSTASFVSELAAFFFEGYLAQTRSFHGGISTDVLEAIDRDGKGFITQADFTEYTLVTHDLVTQSELDAISAHFERLDPHATGRVEYNALEYSVTGALRAT